MVDGIGGYNPTRISRRSPLNGDLLTSVVNIYQPVARMIFQVMVDKYLTNRNQQETISG